MDSEQRAEMLHDLDLNYRRTAHEYELVVRDEEARRLKLRSILLGDEASGLKDQLAQRDSRVRELVEQIDFARMQLGDAHEKSRRQDTLVQSQAREINNLREELSAFNAVSQDSAKILSEKLALSREVALLKPELEHVRSQLAHQKDVLAEKLALERQLNTLEVELANEKRAAQRAAQKREHESAVEEDLRRQLHELEKEVAAEKRRAEDIVKQQESRSKATEKELQSLREQLAKAEKSRSAAASGMGEETNALRAEKEGAVEQLAQLREELAEARQALADEKEAREKMRKENEQALVDAEERQEAMGDRVDMLRSRLRETREELKRCKAELEKAQERAVHTTSVATTTVPLKGPGAKANAKKKRAADEMPLEDNILLTPGAADDRPKRPLKKRGFDVSMVGGKSEFSITPFLNKTAALDGSPKLPGDDATPTPAVQFRGAAEETTTTTTSDPAAPEPTAAPASAKPVEKRPRGRPRTKPLSDTSPSTKNLTTRERKAPRAEPTLDMVAEEEPEDGDSASHEPENRSAAATAAAAAAAAAATSAPDKPEPKKKRRKLLGAAGPSTLFDGGEDEGERVMGPAVGGGPVAAAATGKAPGGKAAAGKALGKGGVAGRFGPGVKNAFAGSSFSPLKRDRRGVAASFLA